MHGPSHTWDVCIGVSEMCCIGIIPDSPLRCISGGTLHALPVENDHGVIGTCCAAACIVDVCSRC